MWTLNPLLLTHLVAAAHVDALLVLCAVAAVLTLRRSAFAAGLLGGAAAAVKLSGALVCAALAWTVRPRAVFAQGEQPNGRKPLLALVLGAVCVTPPAYLLAGGATALGPVRRAARFVSFGSPWRALSVPLEHYYGYSTSRAIVSALSLAAFVAMLWLLARALPSPALPALPADGAARSAAVTTLAWLVAATYVLPWYDSWAWPFLALLPASRWDRWLLARTTVLTLAYLPGRTLPMPPLLLDLLSGLRMRVTPLALGLLACIAVAWARERTP